MRYPGNRWELVWSHREELLEIARRRSPSAEDAVQEAMTRAVEDQTVQFGRVGPWLRDVTVRLCADRHRQVARDVELSARPPLLPASPDPVEDMVCDRAEARWLADRSVEVLPAHQAEALRLRSQGFDVGQVARHLGLSYRAAESLLARARRSLRGMAAGVLSLAATVWLFTRRLPGTGADRSAAATSTAVTVAVVALTLPVGPAGGPDGPRPGDSGARSASRSAPEAVYPAPRATPPAPLRSPAPARVSHGPRFRDTHGTGRTDEDVQRAGAGKPPGTSVDWAAALRAVTVVPVRRPAADAVSSLPADAAGGGLPAAPTELAAPTEPAVPGLAAPAVPEAPAVPSGGVVTGTGGPAGLP